MRPYIFQYLIISFLIMPFGCNSKRDQVRLENKVLNQVFKTITDSVIFYRSFPPPPPPPLTDFSGKIIDDTSNISWYKKLVSQIDTTREIVTISDSTKIEAYLRVYSNFYQPYFDSLGFNLPINEIILTKPEVIKIDTTQITNTGRFELVRFSSLSKIQNNHPFLEYSFVYYGNLTLSRIYFNESTDKGFLTCDIEGRFFHYSYLIFIKNVSDKWVITKMKRLSIR